MQASISRLGSHRDMDDPFKALLIGEDAEIIYLEVFNPWCLKWSALPGKEKMSRETMLPDGLLDKL